MQMVSLFAESNLTKTDNGTFIKPDLRVNDTGDAVVHTPAVKKPFLSGRFRIRITVNVLCRCYGHSQRCDKEGRCLNCVDNTAGRYCEKCADGFYGDAKNGGKDACKACKCPGSKGSDN